MWLCDNQTIPTNSKVVIQHPTTPQHEPHTPPTANLSNDTATTQSYTSNLADLDHELIVLLHSTADRWERTS